MSQAFPPTPTMLAISSPLLGRITNPRRKVRALEGAGRRARGPEIAPKTQTYYFTSFSFFWLYKDDSRNSLVVQWLGLLAFTAEGPGWGAKIPQAMWCSQNK